MNKTKTYNIPELRFSEFSCDWDKIKLGDIGKVKMCKRVFSHQTSEKEEIPFFKIGTFGKEPDAFISRGLYEDFKRKYSFPKVGDILMSASGTLGRTVVYDGEDAYFQDSNIVWLENDEKLTSNDFLFYIYQIVRYQSEGGTIQRLYNSIIQSTKYLNPSHPEQQKIAAFLTTVDKRITQLTQQIENVTQYKKGVMQKIFKQELRFKPALSEVEGDDEGNNYPDWEEKMLGEVGAIVNGLTYSPNDIDGKGVLVLRSSNIQNGLITLGDNVYVNVSEGNFNPVIESDILICVRNGSKRLIGKNAIIKMEHVGVAFGAFMTIYRSKDNLFLFHYFSSNSYKKEVYRNLGATINSINGSDLKKFKVPFPCLEEQTKISNFLSGIDIKIVQLNQQLTAATNFKKALLQQMFV